MNFEQNSIINPWAKLDERLNTKLYGSRVERLSQTKVRFHPSSNFPSSNLTTRSISFEDLKISENDEYFKK